MRKARWALCFGLLVLNMLLADPLLVRADSPAEAEAKRKIEEDRVKKLVGDARDRADRLRKTQPGQALEVLRSALSVLESDEFLAPAQRASLIRRLRLDAKYLEAEIAEGKRGTPEKALETDVFSPQDLKHLNELLFPKSNFSEYRPMVAAVLFANKVVLYEGLPYQSVEEKLLEEERKSKKTVEIHNFPFYQELLPLTKQDGEKLKDVFCKSKSFSELRGGMKWCGGFHPDYCIEWQDGKDVYQILICFGCHEAKFYGPKAEVYCDINPDAYKQFQMILKPYRKNRPEQKREP
jgi:hypothetical protein